MRLTCRYGLGLWIMTTCFFAEKAFAGNLVFEAFGGVAYNAPTRLKIEQAGFPPIEMTARYSTRPFTPAPYCAFRLGWWNGNGGVELEYLHHKIYLDNTTNEIQVFNIHFGYSFYMINYAWNISDFIFRVGAGGIVTHPVNTIRGKKLVITDGSFGGEYYLSGAGMQVAFERRFYLTKFFMLNLETKITYAYVTVPVVDGQAAAPNIAFHGLLGIGFRI